MGKYILLYEAFKSRNISKTLSFIKNQVGESSARVFLSVIKDLYLKRNLDISELSDDYFDYYRKDKALGVTSLDIDNDYRVHSLKYWFSIEDGFIGTTVTKPYKLGKFIKGEWVKWDKDGKAKYGEVTNQDGVAEGMVKVISDGKIFAISEDKVSKLSNSELKEKERELISQLSENIKKKKLQLENDKKKRLKSLDKRREEVKNYNFELIPFDIRFLKNNNRNALIDVSKIIDTKLIRCWYYYEDTWYPALLTFSKNKFWIFQRDSEESDDFKVKEEYWNFRKGDGDFSKFWWICEQDGDSDDFQDGRFASLVLMMNDIDIDDKLEFSKNDISNIKSILDGQTDYSNFRQSDITVEFNDFPQFDIDYDPEISKSDDVLYEIDESFGKDGFDNNRGVRAYVYDKNRKKEIKGDLWSGDYGAYLLHDDGSIGNVGNNPNSRGRYKYHYKLYDYSGNKLIKYGKYNLSISLLEVWDHYDISNFKIGNVDKSDKSEIYRDINVQKTNDLLPRNRVNYDTIEKKADFGIIFYFDKAIRNKDFDVTKKISDREESRSGATAFMSDDEIKNQNIERYANEITSKINLDPTKINKLFLMYSEGDYVLPNLLGMNDKIRWVETIKNDLFTYISTKESGRDSGAESYLEIIKDKISNLYKSINTKTRDNFNKFEKVIKGDDRISKDYIDVYEKYLNISKKLKEKISNQELDTINDLEFFIKNLNTIVTSNNLQSIKPANNFFRYVINNISSGYIDSAHDYLLEFSKNPSYYKVDDMNKGLDNLEKLIKYILR